MTDAEEFKDVFGVKPSELAIKKLKEFIAYYEQLDLDVESEEDDKTNEADCLDAFRYALNAIETNCKWEETIEKIKAEIETKNTSIEDFADTHGWVNGLTNEHNAHEADLAIIDKHTKELIK